MVLWFYGLVSGLRVRGVKVLGLRVYGSGESCAVAAG